MIEIDEKNKEVRVCAPTDASNFAALMNEALNILRARGPEWRIRTIPTPSARKDN